MGRLQRQALEAARIGREGLTQVEVVAVVGGQGRQRLPGQCLQAPGLARQRRGSGGFVRSILHRPSPIVVFSHRYPARLRQTRTDSACRPVGCTRRARDCWSYGLDFKQKAPENRSARSHLKCFRAGYRRVCPCGNPIKCIGMILIDAAAKKHCPSTLNFEHSIKKTTSGARAVPAENGRLFGYPASIWVSAGQRQRGF